MKASFAPGLLFAGLSLLLFSCATTQENEEPLLGIDSSQISSIGQPRTSSTIRGPHPVKKVMPELPEKYRNTDQRFVYLVTWTVDATGNPTELQLRAPINDPELDQCVREACMQWRFDPATKNRVPEAGKYMTFIRVSKN